jgi:hypothetical protein
LNVDEVLGKLYNTYMYPARFPAKIFNAFFSKLSRKGVVFDPFAGSGSLALAAYLRCLDSVVWDLNPMIHVIVSSSIKAIEGVNVKDVLELIEEGVSYGKPWLPEGADFWWPSEVLDLLSRVWGYFKDNMAYFKVSGEEMFLEPLDERWSLYAVLALYASRRLSLADDNVPKWFRSRYKRSKLEELFRRSSIESLYKHYVELKARRVARAQEMLRGLSRPMCKPTVTVRALDAVEAKSYPDRIVGVLTSPPYIQAQEYIRSFLGELMLLGVPLNVISKLRSLEIPYRPPTSLEVRSRTYNEVLAGIQPKFKRIVESYFTNTLTVLERTVRVMEEKAVLGVFAGEATVGGKPVPITRILKEHLIELGMKEIGRGDIEDRIRRRRLFKKRKNMNPDGIEVEYLTFLEKS